MFYIFWGYKYSCVMEYMTPPGLLPVLHNLQLNWYLLPKSIAIALIPELEQETCRCPTQQQYCCPSTPSSFQIIKWFAFCETFTKYKVFCEYTEKRRGRQDGLFVGSFLLECCKYSNSYTSKHQ